MSAEDAGNVRRGFSLWLVAWCHFVLLVVVTVLRLVYKRRAPIKFVKATADIHAHTWYKFGPQKVRECLKTNTFYWVDKA